MSYLSIAIDGPAGSGKSTVAKRIAQELNITYLDTGAMYRAVTYKVLQSQVDLKDQDAMSKLLEETSINFINGEIYLNQENISEAIRMPAINQNVSSVASLKEVREKLVELQQQIAAHQSIVMDGRDIGTKVLPNATYKFFLTASIEERAKRRFIELKEKGLDVELNELIEEIRLRDYEDSNRKLSPLKPAEDAIHIDTTKSNIQEVVAEILHYTKV